MCFKNSGASDAFLIFEGKGNKPSGAGIGAPKTLIVAVCLNSKNSVFF